MVIRFFSSDNCFYCKDVRGILERIKAEIPGVEIITIDACDMDECRKYSVCELPTVDIYKDGVLIDRIVGKREFARYMKRIS